MRIFNQLTISTALAASSAFASGDMPALRLHGQAWVEAGRIMESSRQQFGNTGDSIDVAGTNLQGTGAQLTIEADLDEKLTASFGFGVRQISNSLGIFVQSGSENYSPYSQSFTTYRGYVAQSHLTYFEGPREAPWLSVTAGSFSHIYNRNTHNLGAYLLRGPVYPGILISGFQEFAVDSAKATQLGLRIRNRLGNFEHSLLFVNEHELPPTFDWSLAYIANYRVAEGFQVGAGVNFHRLLTYDRSLRTHERYESNGDTITDSRDTVTYTHRGTKLMVTFSADLKQWLPSGGMGPEDLKLYGEAALLGVRNYGTLYDDPKERIPAMLGFNIPAFGWLDRLSVEAEWFGSPYRNDLYNIGNPDAMVAPWRWNPQRPVPSPVPVEGEAKDDDWRWSVLLEKSLASHIRFTGQVASDHHRPLPFSTGLIYQEGGTGAAFSSPSEWYFMARLGLYF